jgi:signal transduction histidine kinase/HPt (histidine-containing phosphotransfer) domain-containing protein/ActR/RegA family two-component response regulator
VELGLGGSGGSAGERAEAMIRRRINLMILASWLVVIGLMLMVMLASIALFQQQKDAAIEEAGRANADFVQASEVSINRVLIGIDVLLGGTGELLHPTLRKGGQIDEELASNLLRSSVAQNLLVRDLFVMTPDGQPVVGTVSREQMARRELPKGFLAEINSKFVPELVFSEPVPGWSSPEPTLFFGRTLQLAPGVKWVVIAEVTIPALTSVFNPLGNALLNQVVLEDQHGHVLALVPRDDAKLGSKLPEAMTGNLLDGAPRMMNARLNTEPSLLAARAVLYRNAFISASTPMSTIMDRVHLQQKPMRWVVGAMFLLLLAAGALSHNFLYRLIRSRVRAESLKQTLDQALGSISDGFLITDSKDCVVTWNEQYIDYLPYLRTIMAVGVPAIQLIEAGARYIYPNGTKEEIDAWVQWRMGKRHEGVGQIEFVNTSGQALVFIDRRTPDGGVVCVLRDVTVLKKTERSLRLAKDQAEVASAAKTHFLATMSHEIRTPMNAVLGMAQLLAKSGVSEAERVDYSRVIINSGEKLLSLLNDLLDISKIEAGKIQIEQQKFRPAIMLEDMVALFGANAQNKGLTLQTAWRGDSRATYTGDAQKIRQMLANLVSNAIKFTQAGQIRLEVTLLGVTDSKAMLRFSVTDSGVGISPEDQEKLFQPFSQVGQQVTLQSGGTGLGLSIVKGYAEAMGGTVGVHSDSGKGAEFWFTVSAQSATTSELDTSPPTVFDTGLPSTGGLEGQSTGFRASQLGARMRVLVVDDNPVNRQVVELMLAKMSTDVITAGDGQEAVMQIKSEKPDLVFMDCMMPIMDGFEATRAIRAWEAMEGLERTPIVALTARAYEADQQACRDAGMDDFLSKPIELKGLERVIRRFRGQVTFSMGEELAPIKPPAPLPDEYFDEQGLISRLEGEVEIAKRVVELYLKDMPNYVSGLRSAAEGLDTVEVARLSHALVGASANVSATRMASLARQIENWARQGALSDLTATLPMVEQCVKTTQEKLRAFCES